MVEHQMLENVVSKIGLVTGHSSGTHPVGRFGAPRADFFILNSRMGVLKIDRFCTWRPSAAIPAAQFHTRIEDESVLDKILNSLGAQKIFRRSYAQLLLTRALGDKRLGVKAQKIPYTTKP